VRELRLTDLQRCIQGCWRATNPIREILSHYQSDMVSTCEPNKQEDPDGRL